MYFLFLNQIVRERLNFSPGEPPCGWDLQIVATLVIM